MDDEFADIAQLIRRSMLFRMLQAMLAGMDSAVQQSRVVAAVRVRVNRFAQLRQEERVRNVALFFLVAAIGELVLVSFVPARSAPAMPRPLWGVIAILAAVPVAIPQTVLTAWKNRKMRWFV